jgi:hypothetical protein
MNQLPVRPIHNVQIEHNGDVNHGLDHIYDAWNSHEIEGAFHQARNFGTGEFRAKNGDLYSLKHQVGDKFSLEYKGR